MNRFQHIKDNTGRCSQEGFTAEVRFKKLLEDYGDIVTASNLKGQYSGIDLISDLLGTFDVKARKRTSRSDDSAQDKYIWVEFKNVGGGEGWLYGKADCIAFERRNDFLITKRSDLVQLCETLVDLSANVSAAKYALYKSYQRKGRKDQVAMIKFQDIIDNINFSTINKGQDHE
jgi:hypothetical protein